MAELIARLREALGESGVLTGEEALEKAQGGWSHLGFPLAVVRPSRRDRALCHGAVRPAWLKAAMPRV